MCSKESLKCSIRSRGLRQQCPRLSCMGLSPSWPVCGCWCVQRIVLQATVYLPSTTATAAAQEPPGLGKAAKAPAESRGKPVEGAAAGGSEVSGSKSRSLPPAFRTTHRPLHSHQQQLWRCCVTQLVRQSAPVNSISETEEETESARVLTSSWRQGA